MTTPTLSTPLLIKSDINDPKDYNLYELLQDLDEQVIPISYANDGYFGYDEHGNEIFHSTALNKEQVIEIFSKERRSRETYSVRNRRFKSPPEIRESLKEFNKKNSLYSSRLWASVGTSITPLHYDASNNVLSQIKGNKEITFFAPFRFNEMYPYKNSFMRGHVSQVDFRKIDMQTYKNFPSEPDLIIKLEEGESVMIPAYWWHYVESSDESIAVNYWWDCEYEQLLDFFAVDSLVRTTPNDLFQLSRIPTKEELFKMSETAKQKQNHLGSLILLAWLFERYYIEVTDEQSRLSTYELMVFRKQFIDSFKKVGRVTLESRWLQSNMYKINEFIGN